MTAPKRTTVLTIIALSLLGLAAAGVIFQRYAAKWLRSTPIMPRCVLSSRGLLAREELVSPSIEHSAPGGGKVYLHVGEARAVICLEGISTPLGEHFAGALAEVDPAPRARALLKVAREQVSDDPVADREALAFSLLASSALGGRADLPEIKAAQDELHQRIACRFSMRTPCPVRPPIPRLVWIAGVPSALGLLFGAGVGLRALVSRVRARRRADRPAARAS